MSKKKIAWYLGLSIMLLCLLLMSLYKTDLLNTPHYQETERFLTQNLHPASNPDEFISIWDTSLTRYGSNDVNQIHLPLEPSGDYNFTVDWGDGVNDTITIWNQTEVTHTYSSIGLYVLTITGKIHGWRFNHQGDVDKILVVQQWGCLQLGNSGSYFYGCSNLKIMAIDTLNLTETTNLFQCFAYCGFTSGESINSWDVSMVTNMSRMFAGPYGSLFNINLNLWNVSNVKDMSGMFYYAKEFNQPLDTWDVSNVNDMSNMFYFASNFDQPLDSWNISNVKDMSGMFYYAYNFNHPLNSWNVSKVQDMSNMFSRAFDFNQPLDTWDVSNVIKLNGMFQYSHDFNQPLDSWDVSNVTDMSWMFFSADLFNQPLDLWDTSNVIDMSWMFSSADLFNQPLDSWDVSNVIDMSWMFSRAEIFNRPLDVWDVSNVIDMSWMFSAADNFNQPLETWDVSSVTDMSGMFSGAHLFNQPLDAWDVSSVIDMSEMFSAADNFDQPLDAWDVSSVIDMSEMFSRAYVFNHPLDAWEVSNVTDMSEMFFQAEKFNRPLNSWDVSRVFDMSYMFMSAYSFNQPLRSWDMSNAIFLSYMFQNAYSFDQNLGTWNISTARYMDNMFRNVTLSTSNYDALLRGWSKLDLQPSRFFDAGASTYSVRGIAARKVIVEEYGWTIIDGGYTQSSRFLDILFSIVFGAFAGVGISLIVVKQMKRRRTETPLPDYTPKLKPTRPPVSSNHHDNHADMNLFYYEKFNELKKTLKMEDSETARDNLVNLLEQIKHDNQIEYIDKKIISDISRLIQEITEKNDTIE